MGISTGNMGNMGNMREHGKQSRGWGNFGISHQLFDEGMLGFFEKNVERVIHQSSPIGSGPGA